MESPRHLMDQFAAMRGVSATMAKRALYLEGLAKGGCTLSYASERLGVESSTVRLICRRFMIDLSDYRPYARLERKGLPRPQAHIRDINQPASALPIFAA